MPKVNPHADPTRRDLGPAALGRTVKKLFSYYPVLAPVTFVCILFSSIVSFVPSLFTQNIIQIIESGTSAATGPPPRRRSCPISRCSSCSMRSPFSP